MLIRALVDEDFTNYKKPAMFIGIGSCNWKCCKEANIPITVCQNSELANQSEIEVSTDEIFRRYTSNSITKAVVIGGLEPWTRTDDVFKLIQYFRDHSCYDEFVIYTGFKSEEIPFIITFLKNHFTNIIMKFGRYVPNSVPRFDNVLGVTLISDKQYAERIC